MEASLQELIFPYSNRLSDCETMMSYSRWGDFFALLFSKAFTMDILNFTNNHERSRIDGFHDLLQATNLLPGDNAVSDVLGLLRVCANRRNDRYPTLHVLGNDRGNLIGMVADNHEGFARIGTFLNEINDLGSDEDRYERVQDLLLGNVE